MHRHWIVNKTNQEYIAYLSRSASISPVLAQILVNRGIKTPEAIHSFLNPLSCLSDPLLIEGMDRAVERIREAARKGERVLIHGDYDADGISATAIALTILERSGTDCRYFIPDRIAHGYGFRPRAVEYAKEIGATLIVTVDCGITSFDAAALCRTRGIDLIITDHHEPMKCGEHGAKIKEHPRPENKQQTVHAAHPDQSSLLLPDALAVINPKISDPDSELSMLSGAGIALKLAQAITAADEKPGHDLLDLAALGTLGDIVPLWGENRLLVKEGLRLLQHSPRPGIRALKRAAGIEGKTLKTGHLLFALIPRINAAGRISNAADVVRLLLTDSEDEAIELSSWLDRCNTERQQIEEKVFREAMYQLEDQETRSVIVLSSAGWHKGVIGIVASRIAEALYRPTFILSIEGTTAKGSARSIPPFDIYRALTRCKTWVKDFGGHRQAAGLELDVRDIRPFADCMNSVAEASLSPEDWIPVLEIDATVTFAEITFDLAKEFDMIEPCGFGNPEPLLGSKSLEVLSAKVLKELHLKMKLRQNNRSLDAIGFHMAPLFRKLEDPRAVDIVYTPCVNTWEGNSNLQLHLKALRPST
ncbi:MAG: single-stranded-DNA-specific exonuclease RecJ [Nitrospirota bacterium]